MSLVLSEYHLPGIGKYMLGSSVVVSSLRLGSRSGSVTSSETTYQSVLGTMVTVDLLYFPYGKILKRNIILIH